MRQAARDALSAAAVALMLAIPLVGFRAVDTGGPLGLELRFGWVAVTVAAVFLGRLAVLLLGRRRGQRPPRRAAVGERWPNRGTWMLRVIVIVAVLLPMVAGGDRRIIG